MPLDLWFESGRSSGRNWSARWLRRFFPEAALASRGLRAWSISFRHPSKGKPHCPGRRSALRKYAFPLATFPQEESADCVGPWQVQSNRYLRRQKARAPNVVPGPSCDTRRAPAAGRWCGPVRTRTRCPDCWDELRFCRCVPCPPGPRASSSSRNPLRHKRRCPSRRCRESPRPRPCPPKSRLGLKELRRSPQWPLPAPCRKWVPSDSRRPWFSKHHRTPLRRNRCSGRREHPRSKPPGFLHAVPQSETGRSPRRRGPQAVSAHRRGPRNLPMPQGAIPF